MSATSKTLFQFIAVSAFAAFATLAFWSGCDDSRVAGLEGYTLTTSALPPAGGSVSVDDPQKSYEAGASVTVVALANPGYKFVEWSGASASASQSVTVTMNGNQTLIAHFNYIAGLKHGVTVTFNTNGGVPSAISAVTLEGGSALGARFPADPTREGFDFSEWFDGEGIEYTAQTPIVKDITLTAGWVKRHGDEGGGEPMVEVPSYTVFFDVNGGSPADISPIAVDSGGMMGTRFPLPVRTGYTFGGWFDGAAQYTASTVILRDVALTAAWAVEEKNFTVSFDAAGGSPSIIASVTVANGMALGTAANLPADPTKAGNYFAGWFDNAVGERYNAGTIILKDVALTARWTEAQQLDTAVNQVKPPDCLTKGRCLTVSFDSDGGSPNMINAVMVDSGKALGTGSRQLPLDPSKSGYFFGGWFDEPSGAGTQYNSNTIITKDVTLTAKWTPVNQPVPVKRFTVSFDPNGGIPSMIASVIVDSGTALGTGSGAFPGNPTRSSYVFVDWFDGATQYTTSTVVTSDVALVAKWKRLVTVSFNTNGANQGSIASITVDSGSALGAAFPKIPAKTGYDFTGWFNASTEYTWNTVITKDVTLTASWTIKRFTVWFETNGGVSSSPLNPVTLDSGATLGQAFPKGVTREKYRLVRWVDMTTSPREYNENTPITKSMTIMPEWIMLCKVSFNMNGGAMDNADAAIVEYGNQLLAIVSRTPTKAGYRFCGWYGDDGKACTPYTYVYQDITLAAKWIPRYTVLFDAKGGSLNYPDATIDSGTYFYNIAESPTKTGQTFRGWTDDGVNIYLANASLPITKDMAFTAVWRCAVKLNKNDGTSEIVYVDSGVTFGTIMPPNLQRADRPKHTFAGWWENDQWTTPYAPSKVITQNIEVLAMWTVTINGKEWMADNLNIVAKDSSRCNDCPKYGALYQWDKANTICPSGWHLSTNAEWENLIKYAGGGADVGKKLRSAKGWSLSELSGKDGNGTDDYGFTAMPGGTNSTAWLQRPGEAGYWWTSTDNGSGDKYYWSLLNSSDAATQKSDSRGHVYSVRCVRN